MIEPAPAVKHQRHHRAREQERTGEIDVEHALPVGDIDFVQPIGEGRDAGIVDQHMQLAMRIRHRARRDRYFVLVCDVEDEARGLAARVLRSATPFRSTHALSRSAQITSAPAAASPSANSRPSPEPAPVTSATLPSSLNSSIDIRPPGPSARASDPAAAPRRRASSAPRRAA